MATLEFPVTSTFNVITEFRSWMISEPVDAGEAATKLNYLSKYGTGYLNLYGTDIVVSADLYLRSKKDWVHYYVATSTRVVALYVARLNNQPLSQLDAEAVRRRVEVGA